MAQRRLLLGLNEGIFERGDDDLTVLCTRLSRAGAPRAWSLCLSGPPGAGKSAFARYLAGRLGLPVLQKRASDLLSMWVGGSEKAIAAAIAEARRAARCC